MSEKRATPLGFLDLPAELRCMIYDYLPTSFVKHTIARDSISAADARCAFTFVTKGVPVQLLATCHLIHKEANQVLAHKVEALKHTVPCIYIDSGDAGHLSGKEGIITAIVDWLQKLRSCPNIEFGYWLQFQDVIETYAFTRNPVHATIRKIVYKAGMFLYWQSKAPRCLEYYSKQHPEHIRVHLSIHMNASPSHIENHPADSGDEDEMALDDFSGARACLSTAIWHSYIGFRGSHVCLFLWTAIRREGTKRYDDTSHFLRQSVNLLGIYLPLDAEELKTPPIVYDGDEDGLSRFLWDHLHLQDGVLEIEPTVK